MKSLKADLGVKVASNLSLSVGVEEGESIEHCVYLMERLVILMLYHIVSTDWFSLTLGNARTIK